MSPREDTTSEDTGEETQDRQQNKSTTRVLQILACFAHAQTSLGLTQLAQQLGMTKNMVYRALGTLVEHGLLVRDATGLKYELGYGVLALRNSNFPEPDFLALADSTLLALHELTGETVQLCVRSGESQVVVAGYEGEGEYVARVRLGLVAPLHASAASRVILAALTDGAIEAYYRRNAPLRKFTSHTIVTLPGLLKEAQDIRRRGYALGIGDFRLGAAAYAFGVVGANGQPHGAITVGGPKSRFDQRAPKFLPQITEIIDGLRQWARLYPAECDTI